MNAPIETFYDDFNKSYELDINERERELWIEGFKAHMELSKHEIEQLKSMLKDAETGHSYNTRGKY